MPGAFFGGPVAGLSLDHQPSQGAETGGQGEEEQHAAALIRLPGPGFLPGITSGVISRLDGLVVAVAFVAALRTDLPVGEVSVLLRLLAPIAQPVDRDGRMGRLEVFSLGVASPEKGDIAVKITAVTGAVADG